MANYRGYGYQYETSPRKINPEYRPSRNNKSVKKQNTTKKVNNVKNKSTSVKGKKKSKYNNKPIIYIALMFSMLFVISYRYSLINESYNNKENIKTQVNAVKKENEQLKVSIQNSLNLSSVEKAAESKLGMQKLDNNQKVYLNLPKKDYVEPASEEVIINDNKTWFEKIIQKLTQIIK